MKAKVGISAIVGSEPNTITYYSVDIYETKYQQSMHNGRWERWHIQKQNGYVCGYHTPRGYWHRVTSEKIISQLNAAVAEHLATPTAQWILQVPKIIS